MINRLDSKIPVKTGRDNTSFECFGRVFPYDRANLNSKALAAMEAERYGSQVLTALQDRLGRPLSTREQITGKPDPVPAPKLEGSLRPIPGPPQSPYAIRAAEVEARWRTLTPADKAKKIKRLEELAEADRQWQEKHAGDVAADARQTNPLHIKATQLAKLRWESLRTDGSVDQETVDLAAASVTALERGEITAEQYIASLNEAPPAATAKSLYEAPQG